MDLTEYIVERAQKWFQNGQVTWLTLGDPLGLKKKTPDLIHMFIYVYWCIYRYKNETEAQRYSPGIQHKYRDMQFWKEIPLPTGHLQHVEFSGGVSFWGSGIICTHCQQWSLKTYPAHPTCSPSSHWDSHMQSWHCKWYIEFDGVANLRSTAEFPKTWIWLIISTTNNKMSLLLSLESTSTSIKQLSSGLLGSRKRGNHEKKRSRFCGGLDVGFWDVVSLSHGWCDH